MAALYDNVTLLSINKDLASAQFIIHISLLLLSLLFINTDMFVTVTSCTYNISVFINGILMQETGDQWYLQTVVKGA